MKLSYMREISFSLGIMEAWPYKELDMKKPYLTFLRNKKFMFPLWTFLLMLGISYLRKNINVLSFFQLGQCFITVLMNCISVQRILVACTKKYKNVTKEFVCKMHLHHHKDISEHSKKIHHQVDKMCTWASKLIHFQFYSGVLLFNVAPAVNNYTNGMFSFNERPVNGTFEHSVYYDLPFDYETDFLGYLFIFLANLSLTFDCGACFCIFDLYLITILFHLWGHLKILRAHLETFARPEMKSQINDSIENLPWYSEDESENVKTTLINCIRHHLLIKDFMGQLSSAFGFMIGVYYAFHQAGDTILLLECSQLDAKSVIKYGILTVFLFQQLIQISIVFELLGTQSESIRDAVYSVPWECMDKKNRKIVLFYLYNVQEPLNFKAMGMVPVGVQTMASILKTSFSYFMFLRAVAPSD